MDLNDLQKKTNNHTAVVSSWLRNVGKIYFSDVAEDVTVDMLDDDGNVVQASLPNVAKYRKTIWNDAGAAEGRLKKPMVAFIFDDGFISHWDNAHLFEDRGVRCGFAVNKAYTNISGRMSTAQLKDLQARGFEIINHSFSHIPQTSTIWEQSQQEIEQNYELFDSAGLDIKGFVTPNSQLSNKDRIEILKRHHSYAFTEYKGGAVGSDAIYSETDTNRTVFDLFRPECTSYDNTMATLKAIKATNGLTVFYSHNIGHSGAVSVEDLTAYLDYCLANGIEIVTPRVLAKELARRKGQDYYEPKDVFAKDNLYSGHFGFTNANSVDATFVDDGNKRTITINAGSNVGDLTNSNVYTDHISSVLNQEFVFQLQVHSTLAKTDGFTIGIRVQKASDNSVVYDSESEPVKIDGYTRKYKISTGNITVNEEFYFNLFYRIKGVGADDAVVTVDKPFLVNGSISDIIQDEQAYSVNTNAVRIPFDTTTVASNTKTTVNMVVQENSLVNVEATKITFKKSGFYSVNARCRCTLDADHNGARTIARFLVRNAGRLQSDKSAVADKANFDNNIVDYFDVGDELLLDVWHDTGADQTINNESYYNLLEVIKIN